MQPECNASCLLPKSVGALCVLSLRCDGEIVLILPRQLSLSQGTFRLLFLIVRVLEDLLCVPKCMVAVGLLSISMELVNSGIISKHNLCVWAHGLGCLFFNLGSCCTLY